MAKYTYIIGIDPDVDGHGVATVNTQQRSLLSTQQPLGELLEYLKGIKKNLAENESMMVVVEGGWLNKSNWHLPPKRISMEAAAEIGRKTGRNHQSGIDIVSLCKHYDIPCRVVKPLKKMWGTRDGKISHEQLKYILTYSKITSNIKGRSNPEIRDSALLALEFSDIPLKIKIKTCRK